MPRRGSLIFRLCAIKPVAGCSSELIKVLKEDNIYYLNSDFQIDDEGVLHYKKSYPDNLYDTFGLRLSLSAIAGKNGSGKSTLIELFMMAVNNIGYHIGIKGDLELVTGLNVDLYVQIGSVYLISVNQSNVDILEYDETGRLMEKSETKFNKDDLADLFYTICINYSHYAYNARDYKRINRKDWLSPLFHKNDAYQTPLVINPWRDNGDINIERENSLITSRLVANLIRSSQHDTYSFRNLTESLRAHSLVLAANPSKVYDSELYRRVANAKDNTDSKIFRIAFKDIKKNLRTDYILSLINKEFDFGYEELKIDSNEFEKLAMDYLIRKMISVSLKYEEYYDYFLSPIDDFDYKKIREFVKRLVRDRSHIAFKFRQTLNYLRHKHISFDSSDLTLDALSINIENIIDKKVNYKDKLIELIPPPIFSVDIVLKSRGADGKEDVMLMSLSSGEKQMIYSLSSILYHLYNLDSVSPKSKTKIKYRRAQIILEEIELYFHPEMQRNYVRFLRDSISQLELNYLKEISICFVTHSPFILSDIPNSSILFLQMKDGHAVQVNKFRKTFAANIHDLLSDAFFMNDGVCGAYAIDQINNTVSYLNKAIRRNEVKELLTNNHSDEVLLDELEELENDILNSPHEMHSLLIDNIGEPVIYTKLKEMFNEAFPETRESRIRAEIERLQNLLEKN